MIYLEESETLVDYPKVLRVNVLSAAWLIVHRSAYGLRFSAINQLFPCVKIITQYRKIVCLWITENMIYYLLFLSALISYSCGQLYTGGAGSSTGSSGSSFSSCNVPNYRVVAVPVSAYSILSRSTVAVLLEYMKITTRNRSLERPPLTMKYF